MLNVQIRLSFIQVELLSGPLRSRQAAAIPYPFLVSGPLYEAELAKGGKGSAFKPAWAGGYGSRFWRYYAKKESSTPKELWRTLTPFFRPSNAQITAPEKNFTVEQRAYVYPWAVAVVVTAESGAAQTTADAIAAAFRLRKGGKYKFNIGGKAREAPLAGLMQALIADTRAAAFGAELGKAGDLFSVASVLKGAGANPTEAVPTRGDVHKMMEALTGWNDYWDKLELDDLKQSSIEIETSPPGHVLYGAKRGRFVWFPAGFNFAKKLPCYHQNLTVASMHTESLSSLLTEAADLLAAGKTMADFSVTYGNCVQLAAGLLGRLYGGVDTYRSHSVREQIDRSRTQVNAVRKLFGMGEVKLP
jgi:hypothetical protein